MSYADFSNNLNSYTQYLQGGQSIPLGGGAGFGVKVEMGPGMKRAICNMLAGKGFQPLPDIPICLDLNINQLMGLPGLNAGLMGALGAARDALDAFNEHTAIGPTLARLNAIIAQIAHIANMINFCNEPINPPPIPNFLEDSFGSFLGAGEKILSKLGTVIPDKAAVCYDYRTGQVNIDAYVPDLDSVLAEIRALAEEGLAALSFAQLQKWMETLYAIREEFLSLIEKENNLAAGGVEKTAQGFLALGQAADIRVLNPDTLLYPAEQPKINSITFSDDGVPITILSNSLVKEDAATTQVVEVTFNTPMMDATITGGADAELVAIVSSGQVEGLQITGPVSADGFFARFGKKGFEPSVHGVLAMYHDQGQIAMKLMGFERGVTIAAGLPIPVTTPAHGTAFDIAGKGAASPDSLKRALRVAAQLAKPTPANP